MEPHGHQIEPGSGTFPPPYSSPPPPPGPQWNGKTNGFSIAGLVTAMFGCMFGVVGMGLGIVGIVQSRRNGDRRGRNFGIAAVVVSGLYLVFFVGLAGVAIFREVTDPQRDDAGVLRGERSLSVTDLRPGDCVTDLDSQKGGRVDAVPCSAAHSSEVVGLFRIPDGTTDRDTAAESGCEKLWTSYTGSGVPDGAAEVGLQVSLVIAAAYDEPDVICFAHRESGTATGSIRK